MLSSGNNLGRGSATSSSDMPPLPQCLPLDPITLGNKKYKRSGELRRALGVPFTSNSEYQSFGVPAPKPTTPVATGELKNFKESVKDASRMARDRAKMLRESISKLDKYRGTLSSKKRQRSDFSSERAAGVNLTKIGIQINRNANDTAAQRLEDKTKSFVLNKRIRTSVAEFRGESRSTAAIRQQMATEKDGDVVQTVVPTSVRLEEKTRRLLSGADGLDQKRKKKRSVGTVGNRVVVGDRDIKRVTQPRVMADSNLRQCDAQGFRLKSLPGVGGVNKSEGPLDPTNSSSHTMLGNDQESAPLPWDHMDVSEQRIVAKVNNNRLHTKEDIPITCPDGVMKNKVSRAPRTGSIMALDSSGVHPSSGVFPGCEQPANVNKVSATRVPNNQKHLMSTGSPIHPMTQWVGQRPHKNARSRRANVLSPVSSNVEDQVASQGFPNTDFSARASAVGRNGSHLACSLDNNTPKCKIEHDTVSSPLVLSQNEESGAGYNKIKDKGLSGGEFALSAPKMGASLLQMRKNKVPNDESGDGMRRQGRTGRGSSSSIKAEIPLIMDKSENLPLMNPLNNMRPSNKSKSKSGRLSSKKLKGRKVVARGGQMLNNVSSDFTGVPGESDDDHEELYLAVNSACDARKFACSGPFWQKMEYFFSSVSMEDASYLKQQLNFAEERDENLSQIFDVDYNILGVVLDKEISHCSGEILGSHSTKTDGKSHMERLDKVTPLYQRVLSALIDEDESEDSFNYNEVKNTSLHYASDDSHCGSCSQMDFESKEWDKMESEVESQVNIQTQKNCLFDRLSCDKSATSNTYRNPNTSSSLQSTGLWRGDDDFSHSDLTHTSEICSNDVGQQQPAELVSAGFASDAQYQLMCLNDRLLLELHNIGLYPEILPDLAEGEEVINQDIVELKEGLYQQTGRKKKKLNKIHKAIQKGRDAERRKIEQVAFDQLIEMAHRKRLACRGSRASKSVARKVSRQVAMAFLKRTLVRCKNYEETGDSCFSEPALQNIIISAPAFNNDAKSADCIGSGTASNTYNEASHQEEAIKSGIWKLHLFVLSLIPLERDDFQCNGSIINKNKRREMLIDDVVGSSSRASTLGSDVLGGVNGKRSERDRDQSRDPTKSSPVARAGRFPLDGSQNEHKTKAKPKQKNNQIGHQDRFVEALEPACTSIHGSSKSASNKMGKEARPLPHSKRQDISKVEEPAEFGNSLLHESDPMENLGVSNELGGQQDLSSWLNFDEDGLQDHDSIGLEIPMDDLSELTMLI
ncbi:Spectrin beta chain, brain 3 [Quillaja saponaria]|uniref:Spectrin beta chain, brain 3 n=1 Tax=Quillaja saponaria TaxID=32244 RepID=A0AAD7KZF4_QUISA|nr:Spectrin beta chain, brain 3 [Quillaja saponaria]KAJ7947987.1 Spectrin beta chain, brain 3 [Quillaja saponaria]